MDSLRKAHSSVWKSFFLFLTCGLCGGQPRRSDAERQEEGEPERAPQNPHSSGRHGDTQSSEARLGLRRHPPFACCPAERRPPTPLENIQQLLENRAEEKSWKQGRRLDVVVRLNPDLKKVEHAIREKWINKLWNVKSQPANWTQHKSSASGSAHMLPYFDLTFHTDFKD